MTLPLTFRVAHVNDLERIMHMLADDPLGKYRELAQPFDLGLYESAFQEIANDPNSDMIVAELNGEVVGCLQLTLIPGLSRGGAKRAQIESVRTAADKRGQGIGTALMTHAIHLAKSRGARLVQLTSDVRRTDAHKFYKNLGFSDTHTGFKLDL
ncbi:MAG: GNAT family N-acetyltransferase [Rhodospirillaceae bacterium]|nr:GNAT family N-acetyltransferase [Rhodospirillaceae bacterium]